MEEGVVGKSNAAAFVNLQIVYWYGTESLYVSPTGAWSFGIANGPNPKKKFNLPQAGAFPMRNGQASLVDMVTSIQTAAKTANIKKPDPVDLTAATTLATDTEALETVIGCR